MLLELKVHKKFGRIRREETAPGYAAPVCQDRWISRVGRFIRLHVQARAHDRIVQWQRRLGRWRMEGSGSSSASRRRMAGSGWSSLNLGGESISYLILVKFQSVPPPYRGLDISGNVNSSPVILVPIVTAGTLLRSCEVKLSSIPHVVRRV